VRQCQFVAGMHPILTGEHVVVMLAGEQSEALAAALVGVVPTATSVDEVTVAIEAQRAFAAVDFVVAQFVGPVMVARMRGAHLVLLVERADGLVATYTAAKAPATVEVSELDFTSVRVLDAAAGSTIHDGLTPLPVGWQAGSAIVYNVGATTDSSLHADPVVPAPAESTTPGLEFSDGRRLIVDRPVVIGRKPHADPSPTGEMPAVFTVTSPERAISRTHLRISTRDGRVFLEDLNSTNGTEVQPADQPVFLLEPGQSAILEDGMVVTIGDQVAFKVVTVP